MDNERVASLEKYLLLTCQKSACCKDQSGDPASQGRPWAGQWQCLPGWSALPRGGKKGVERKLSERCSNDTTSEAREPDRHLF